MGMRTTPMGDLIFEDCLYLIRPSGPEGAGVSLFTQRWNLKEIHSSQVGRLERQLEDAIKHAQQRSAFGQAIGKFQSVSNGSQI